MAASVSSRPLRRRALVALALAAGIVIAPVALSTANASAAASVSSVAGSADASPPPALHVGVRQAAVGEQVPVTIVGAAAGTVWEVALTSPAMVVGTVTVGDDGTGTTLIALPAGADPGSIELTASAGGQEISTALSSAGDTAARAESDAAADPIASAAPPAPDASPVVIGAAAVGVAAVAAAAVVIVVRRRRAAP